MTALPIFSWLAACGLAFFPIASGQVSNDVKVIDQYGGILRFGPLKLSELPSRVTVEKGKAALFVDSTDRAGGRVAIYAINDTGKPMVGLIFELNDVWQEAEINGVWCITDFVGPGCGTVPPPQALPEGQAWILTGRDPTLGKIDGKIRYCLAVPGQRPIASAPISGKYSIERDGEFYFDSLAFQLTESFVSLDKLAEWKPNDFSLNFDEGLIALELLRHLEPASNLRSLIRDWLAKQDWSRWKNSGETLRRREILERTLNSEWLGEANEKRFLEHCLEQLEKHDPKQPSQVVSRKVLWRMLGHFSLSDHSHLINPERYDRLETFRIMGNPWGASREQIRRLLDFALKDLIDGHPHVRKVAADFLRKPWIRPDDISADRLRTLLTSTYQPAVRVGITRLSKIEPDDSRIWVSQNSEKLGDQLGSVWEELMVRNEPMSDWEIPVVTHFIRQKPLQAFFSLKSRCSRYHGDGKTILEVPVAFKNVVREYLTKEAAAKTVRGIRPSRSPWSTSPPPYNPDSAFPQYLGDTIAILNSWNDPKDDALIAKFLDHPGSGYSYQNKGELMRFYTVRGAAETALKKRGKPPASPVQLQEKLFVDE